MATTALVIGWVSWAEEVAQHAKGSASTDCDGNMRNGFGNDAEGNNFATASCEPPYSPGNLEEEGRGDTAVQGITRPSQGTGQDDGGHA